MASELNNHSKACSWSERWILIFIPVYFVIMYPQILSFGSIPAPLDLALYHAPWSAEIPNGWKGGSYVLSDIMDYYNPLLKMVYDAVWTDDLPLYTDKIQNGVPWLLVSRHEALSPLMLFPVVVFGPIIGFSIYVMLKFILGASFFVLLMRSWKLSYFAAVFGAMVFVASTYPVQRLGTGFSTLYFLLPVGLFGLQSLLAGSMLWTCLTPIVFFTIFVTGYPPAIAFHATIYIVFIIFVFTTANYNRIRGIRNLFIVGIATLALALPSLIETYLYLIKDLDANYRSNYWRQHLPLKSIVSLIVPGAFENGIQGWSWIRNAIYFGVFPLLVIISALFIPNKRKQHILFFCFLFYLLLVLFNATFLEYFYQYIPILNGTHPNNQIMILGFVMAILSALGIDHIEAHSKDKKQIKIAVALTGVLLLCVVVRWQDEFLLASTNKLIIALVAILVSVLLYLYYFFAKESRRYPIQWIIMIVVTADLVFMGYGFNRVVPKNIIYPSTPGVEYIKTHVGNGKIISLETSMLADTPLWYSISTFGGRGFFTADTKRLYRLINPNAFVTNPTQYLFPADDTTRLSSSLLDVLAVRYLTANPQFATGDKREWIESHRNSDGSQKYKLVHSGDMAIFENLTAQEKAFLVSKIAVSDSENIYKNMYSEAVDLNELAWIDKSTISTRSSQLLESYNNIPLEWKIEKSITKNSSQMFSVFSSRPSLMVVGDNYHSGWKVRVNGQDESLLRVNFALRGVVVPAGWSEIGFVYSPAHFRYSIPLALSVFLLLIMAALINVAYIYYCRKKVTA